MQNNVLNHPCLRVVFVLIILICSAGSAWCSRKDNGGSNYGVTTDGCPAGAGSSSPAFGSVIVLCFSPQSNLSGSATILELYSSLGSTTLFPSLTLNIDFPDGDPTDTMTFGGNFGLITCDNNGSTVPCTNPAPSSSLNMITSGNDLAIRAGSPDSTTLTLGNVKGDLVLYFTAPAYVTDITGEPAVNTPEPASLALLGSGLAATLLLFIRRRAKGQRS